MSSSFYVEMAFNMGQIGADLAAHLDEVAAAFAHVKEVDGDVAVDTGTGRVTLCMTLDAATRYDAVGIALTAARTAIHSAGGSTPGWDDARPPTRHRGIPAVVHPVIVGAGHRMPRLTHTTPG